MSAATEQRCICGHADFTHVFDGAESVCSKKGCSCTGFYQWEVVLSDPCGKHRKIQNVFRFIVNNEHLFEFADLEHKQTPSDMLHGRWYCGAYNGLLSVVEEATENWKGWTLLTRPKTFINKP